MSEAVKHSPENNKFEELAKAKTGERHHQHAEYSKAEKEHKVAEAQAAVAQESGSTERAALPSIVDDRPQLIDHAIKAMRMRTSLKHVQKKLKPTERSFSKVVHQPLVQKVSETASQTIARPSGILGGGLTAFVGCLGYQVLTRYYGLPYNFSFFILFFVVGFVLGLAGEYFLRQSRRKSTH